MEEINIKDDFYLEILYDDGNLWIRKDRNKLRRAPFRIAIDWELDYQGMLALPPLDPGV